MLQFINKFNVNQMKNKKRSNPSTLSTPRVRQSEATTRPPNAWILYLKDKRAEIELLGYPVLESKDILNHVGMLWKDETVETRALYNNMWRQGIKHT